VAYHRNCLSSLKNQDAIDEIACFAHVVFLATTAQRTAGVTSTSVMVESLVENPSLKRPKPWAFWSPFFFDGPSKEAH